MSPIFKKEDETDRENYRPVSILSVPSKILESEVNDSIIDHVYMHNNLISDQQWAYRRGYSTKLLLLHLTETWRKAVDSGLVLGVACVDFKKAFDSVSHTILGEKLKNRFGFEENLAWIKSYMNERKQFTIANGSASTTMPIKFGIPQGSVLGPTLFILFTNDIPSRITAATTYMYADDTTLFCIGGRVDEVIRSMNLALEELYNWCNANKLTPYPKKSEALIITRAPFVGPLHQVRLGKTSIRWK